MSVEEVNKLLIEESYMRALLLAEHLVYFNPTSQSNLRALVECNLRFGFVEAAETISKDLSLVNHENPYSEKINKIKKAMVKINKEFNDEIFNENKSKDEKFKECLFSIFSAAKDAPKSLFLRIIKAKCYVHREDLANADRVVKDLLTDFPIHPTVMFLQGEISVYRGKLKEGLRFINRSLELGVGDKKREKMRSKVSAMIQYIARADKFIEEERYAESIEAYTNVLEMMHLPKDLLIHFLFKRATAYAFASQQSNAIFDLTQALKHDAKRSDVLLLRAKCYYALRDEEKCAADCQASIAIKPSEKASDLLKKVSAGSYEGQIVIKLLDEGNLVGVANYYLKCFIKRPTRELFISALTSLVAINDFATLKLLLEFVKTNKNLRKLVPKPLKTLVASVAGGKRLKM